MQPSLRSSIPGRIVMCSVLPWLVLIAAALVQTFAGTGKTGASATYSHRVLRVVIPYRAAHEGSGRLRVEVVDPEDRVIVQTERPDEVVKGSSQLKAELKLDKLLALEELVWHRVRYGFRYDDPKVESLGGRGVDLERVVSVSVGRLGLQRRLRKTRCSLRPDLCPSTDAS
jgi:hypothetical protein